MYLNIFKFYFLLNIRILKTAFNLQSALEHQGVKIFQSASQGLNMIVKIIEEEKQYVFDDLVNEFVNRIVHVCWPYLIEAK